MPWKRLLLGKGTACKRLRGWQLEMASGRPSKAKASEKDTLEKDTLEKASALGNKLLSLWAHGALSAVLVRELAHLAMQDGVKGDDLHCMAKAGDWVVAQATATGTSWLDFAIISLCHSQSTSRLGALT